MNTEMKQLKGYEIKERLGTGGFGAVYKAYQTTIGREVAIKIILPGMANQPNFIRRFESEAQLVARLEHPYIVPLFDYWRDPEGAYLVMRWLRGGSLRDALEKGAFEPQATARLLDQVAGALSLAHRNGVIHRDIKPGNILLDEDGNGYLTDFGIAKDLSLVTDHTQQDAIVGSLDYISPEQARSQPVTPRTDIYSLGVTLYEMITGHHPFENVSSIERFYKHINEPLPIITSPLPIDMQDRMNEVIQKATAKNPEHRYPDALVFAADFRDAVGMNRVSLTMEEVLTQREHEILSLITEGLSNKEIAQCLTLTVGTVKWHVNQIYSKLGVRSRVQAIVRARELNLIMKPGKEITTVPITTENFFPINPYKGLLAFQAADYQDFFGREKVTAKLLKRFGETGDYSRFLAVIGPSGSGKSSLVKAGLIPAVWGGELPGSEKWFVAEMLPGAHPIDELEVALTRVAANQMNNLHEQLSRDSRGLVRAAGLILPADNSELLLIIDQFEEVFTLLEDEAARVHFLNLIYTAVTEPRSRVRVVITLRADFYDRPLHYPQFGELVRSRLETIMPLSTEELERAITRPAERVGVKFEPGLVAAIIGDVNYQPGALPLLQYALTELFEHRQGRILTRDAYQQIGGTVGALAKRAEEVYLSLDEADQAITRQLFMRLVTLGEGTEDTRRRTPHSELQALGTDADTIDDIIDTFASYRLLSLDTDPGTRTPTVEVAHEALLREWERLRAWLNESRDEIKLQRQLSDMASEWRAAKQDSSFLARGSRLEQFKIWVESTELALTQRERDFLAASVAHSDAEQKAEEARQAREKQLERRSQNFLRGLVAVLLVATVVAIGLSGLAMSTARDAETERDNARNALATSDANFARVEGQRLHLEADSTMDDGASGNVGMALAVRSLDYGYSPRADMAVTRATRQGIMMQHIKGTHEEIHNVAFSPDGKQILVSGNGGTAIVDVSTGETLQFLPQDNWVDMAAFSPDGTRIVTGGDSGIANIWDAETGELLLELPHESYLEWVLFSPDGRWVQTETVETVFYWDVTDGTLLKQFNNYIDDDHTMIDVFVEPDKQFKLLIYAFEDDPAKRRLYFADAETGEEVCALLEEGSSLLWTAYGSETFPLYVIGTEDNTLYSWDIKNCTLLTEFSRHRGNDSRLLWLDFDPPGNTVVTSDNSGRIFHWDLYTGQVMGRVVVANTLRSIDLSPDESRLAVVYGATNVGIWDLAFPQEPLVIETDQFDSTRFPFYSPDGKSLFIGSFGTYSRWNIEGDTAEPVITYPQPIRTAGLSSDGKHLIISYDTENNFDLGLVDVETGETIREFTGHTNVVNGVNLSPDSSLAVSAGWDGTARLWDTMTGEELYMFNSETGPLADARFSPNGKMIVTTGADGKVWFWDVNTKELIKVLEHGQGVIIGADFSPDGQLIATANSEGYGHIWDVETGTEIHRLVGHTNAVWHIDFSPDGTKVVTAAWDGTARIWDAETGEVVRIMEMDVKNLYSAQFSPDSQSVVVGAERDDRVYIWHVNLDDVIASYCDRQPLDLNEGQRVQYGITDNDPTCPTVQP